MSVRRYWLTELAYTELQRFRANFSFGAAMKYLQPAEPAWPPDTALRVVAADQMKYAPIYAWHEKTHDFILCGFVQDGAHVTFVRSWFLRGTRYAECIHAGVTVIFLESAVKLCDDN
jgi:hypothetical protein